MKKIIALTFITFLISCGNSEKVVEQPKKTLMCDTIIESSFDSTGQEILKHVYKCDSVSEETKK